MEDVELRLSDLCSSLRDFSWKLLLLLLSLKFFSMFCRTCPCESSSWYFFRWMTLFFLRFIIFSFSETFSGALFSLFAELPIWWSLESGFIMIFELLRFLFSFRPSLCDSRSRVLCSPAGASQASAWSGDDWSSRSWCCWASRWSYFDL